MKFFDESLGFGEYKPKAIELLTITLQILEEFNINHFLISGTLLGFIRHNDFIPWDDDIDILVDESILKKKELIAQKYGNINLFYKNKYDSIKICFSKGLEMPDESWKDNYIEGLIPSNKKYNFPFVDMFIYESGPGAHICGEEDYISIDGKLSNMFLPFSGACNRCFRFIQDNQLVFFHNDWLKRDFFPPKKVNFLGIKCNIPNNPHRFLKSNYGGDYMKIMESPSLIHKTNTTINDIIKTDYVRS